MTDPHNWPPPWFDPERFDLLTPLNIKALAHPIRMTLLRLLREDGPDTASGLGQRIAHSSGVTSYHLRQLAGAGLVAEDEALGNQRDRWWRAAHERTAFSFRVPGQTGTTEQLEVAEQYLRMCAQVGYERVLAYVESLTERRAELAVLPWQLGDASISVTFAEARELAEQIMDVVDRFRRDEAGRNRGAGSADEHGPDRHRAVLQFQLVPDPHDLPERDGA